jgi:hypothetical protein
MLTSNPASILDQIFSRAGIPPLARVKLKRSRSNGVMQTIKVAHFRLTFSRRRGAARSPPIMCQRHCAN